MSKKKLKPLNGKLSPLSVERNGQHVIIRNTENIFDGIFFETERTLNVGEHLILSQSQYLDLAHKIMNHTDAFFGIIYPNEKKFNKKLWDLDLVAQELANITRISKITTWGANSYVMLVRDYEEDKDLNYLFTSAWNWRE